MVPKIVIIVPLIAMVFAVLGAAIYHRFKDPVPEFWIGWGMSTITMHFLIVITYGIVKATYGH